MTQFLFFTDYLLLPFYLLFVIFLMNFYFQRKHGNNSKLKKHFNLALYLKLFGSISISMIYQYYYRGAFDGIHYFEGAKMLTSYWFNYPDQFFTVLFQDLKTFNLTNKAGLSGSSVHIFANESFMVSKVAAIFNLVSFNSFLPCAIFFCITAFIGLWNFFIFMIQEFQIPIKTAAYCSLYIPSVLVWGSGIFKDTITFTALLWLFICGYYVFIKKKNIIKNAIGIGICIIIIYFIKLYIIAAFTPFFIIFVINSNKNQIKNDLVRILSTPFILMFGAASMVLFLQNADELFGRYSVDQVLETASQTAYYIKENNAGSAYNLEVDFSSPTGILIAIPQAVNITLFRPYPWEYLNPFILFASIESMYFLYYTIYLFYKIGFFKTFGVIYKSPIAQFGLLFSLTFAFMVGISSANFGSLVRYKIPIMPFYLLFLAVLYKEKIFKGIKPKRRKLIA
ncbi:hypothetical protein [Rufibacter hautae]|uniref:Glycosyltransferase RgtA/B/C/D-like domain-containing protein n=1 Tax=Rufibacter hautae TaxID=2595005 RepID=A0A5B6TC75_9BACT|nr:hypothetical protein [Rufibacter hautae]KAA3436589.1 hypothetical protein FOA19_19585 [Rufibacter hautae]